MKEKINQKLKVYRAIWMLVIITGGLLLTYMIAVENEPGALPLFLVLIGVVGLVFTHLKLKKSII